MISSNVWSGCKCVFMSTNGHTAVEILPEKICNFDSIEHCLIFETDDDKHKKMFKTSKIA